MNKTNPTIDRAAGINLQQAIEPLASYINATKHPRVALCRALQLLCNEVATTNRIAGAHLNTFSENCWS